MGNHNWSEELNNIGYTMKKAKAQQNDHKNTKIAWILMMVSIGVLLMAHGSDANSVSISYGRDFWEPFLIIFVAGAIYFAMGYGLGTFLLVFVKKK